MDQEELARRANVSVVTLRRLEAPDGRGVRRRAWTPEEREERRRRIFEIATRSAALQAKLPAFTEDDLYDEHGL
jgi:hypothetical protein